MKVILTIICFCLLGLCYWALSDSSLFWRFPKMREGIFELICWIMCVCFGISALVILWLN